MKGEDCSVALVLRYMPDIAEVLAYNMKRLRKKAGMTQEALAEKAGISTIQFYETGRRWPERPYLEAIAAALGVPETELFRPIGPETAAIDQLLTAIESLKSQIAELKQKQPPSQEYMIAWGELLPAERAKVLELIKSLTRNRVSRAAKG